jgi:hypothetical protein
MIPEEYHLLATDLQSLAKIIPIRWGKIQNDVTDSQINMFQIHSFTELENQLIALPEDIKNYFRRRWFLWKCAQCDEFIFNMNANVKPNPNSKDQEYDIEFNESKTLRFDIKGTVIPKNFRKKIDEIIDNPSEIVRFFYENQSQGIRSAIQNRLFIVHHSYINQNREMYLRCHWKFKTEVYRKYAEKISEASNFITFENVKTDVLFIFENLDKSITHTFCAIK